MFKTLVHGLIGWYLRRCGGAFHRNAYGPAGRYVVEMTERQYHRYTHVARAEDIGEMFLQVLREYNAELERGGDPGAAAQKTACPQVYLGIYPANPHE